MNTATALRTGRWVLVPARTSAGFAVRNFGLATVRGQIPVIAAWADVDATGRPTAVHAKLDLTRIDTGNPRRDRDLRKPRLLDTAHHPALTFEGIADGEIVDGVLTGRAVTRASLDITSVAPGDAGTITAHATTAFDRAALGVRAPRFLIGRRIAVVIDATFAPPPRTPADTAGYAPRGSRATITEHQPECRRKAVRTTPSPVDTEPRSPVSAWRQTGRAAGYIAGTALLAGTVLFLLDAVGALGSGPVYRPTSAGPLAEQATFYAAYFAHQHHIVWDVIARDTILPVAYLALIIAALAVRNRTGIRHPEGQLLVTLFVVGGILSILADLTFLAAAEYWRQPGWPARPAASTVAVGRTVEGIQTLTHWPEAFGFAVLAGGLVALARLCGRHRIFPASLGALAYLEALLLHEQHADHQYQREQHEAALVDRGQNRDSHALLRPVLGEDQGLCCWKYYVVVGGDPSNQDTGVRDGGAEP